MDATPLMQDIFQATEIWQCFVCKAKEKESWLKKLVAKAYPLSERYSDTFPTYTLHSGQHQLNVLRLYGKILGERLDQLTDLELAILILSAFYHDIGMVFKPSEREQLRAEPEFTTFLDSHPVAKLKVMESGDLPDDIAQWYCRWNHASRVKKFLALHDKDLNWEGNNLRTILAEVCLSHNESCEYIKKDILSTGYWGKTDLKFCAILLRIADLLDFDDTRAPESLFHFLELDHPKTIGEEVSGVEWEKHEASKGFQFDNWNQTNHYTLNFKAAPKKPVIEHGIRRFLDYIEKELKDCISLLRFCSERWRNFKLPEKIDRENIKSQGYTFGEFKFTLDQQQILNLLMGENLYENPYVFLRELLQNAIDTSRHRKFFEGKKGNKEFMPDAIKVSKWYDQNGFCWVRVDDFGMGMTLRQIADFFLKIGKSYYNSEEFKLEKLGYQGGGNDFTPISRFGIGILSCFIVGDVVEVSTRSIYTDNREVYPIRLSLRGVSDYYVVQTDQNLPAELPSMKGSEYGYREKSGTSIAVRIKPNYDLPELDLRRILNQTLFNPEVKVVLSNGEEQGRFLSDLQINKLVSESWDCVGQELGQIKNLIGRSKDKINFKVQKIPVSLQNFYIHPYIKGLLYFFVIKSSLKLDPEVYRFCLNYRLTEEGKGVLNVVGHKTERKNYNKAEFDIEELVKTIEVFNGNSNLEDFNSHIVLAHNGILVQDNELRLTTGNKDTEIIGFIELSDKLRPNLSVARNRIVSISWTLWSHLNYTIRKNIPAEFEFLKKVNYFNLREIKVEINGDELNKDVLLTDAKGWSAEKIYENEASLSDILNREGELDYVFRRTTGPEDILRRKVVELHAVYGIVLYKKSRPAGGYGIIRKASFRKREGDILCTMSCQPLTFCEYENFEGLMPEKLDNQIFNIRHPFSQWLLKAYHYLEKNCPKHLHILLNDRDLYRINTTLETLYNYLPDLYKPAENLRLAEEDFKVDYDALPEI